MSLLIPLHSHNLNTCYHSFSPWTTWNLWHISIMAIIAVSIVFLCGFDLMQTRASVVDKGPYSLVIFAYFVWWIQVTWIGFAVLVTAKMNWFLTNCIYLFIKNALRNLKGNNQLYQPWGILFLHWRNIYFFKFNLRTISFLNFPTNLNALKILESIASFETINKSSLLACSQNNKSNYKIIKK